MEHHVALLGACRKAAALQEKIWKGQDDVCMIDAFAAIRECYASCPKEHPHLVALTKQVREKEASRFFGHLAPDRMFCPPLLAYFELFIEPLMRRREDTQAAEYCFVSAIVGDRICVDRETLVLQLVMYVAAGKLPWARELTHRLELTYKNWQSLALHWVKTEEEQSVLKKFFFARE